MYTERKPVKNILPRCLLNGIAHKPIMKSLRGIRSAQDWFAVNLKCYQMMKSVVDLCGGGAWLSSPCFFSPSAHIMYWSRCQSDTLISSRGEPAGDRLGEGEKVGRDCLVRRREAYQSSSLIHGWHICRSRSQDCFNHCHADKQLYKPGISQRRFRVDLFWSTLSTAKARY